MLLEQSALDLFTVTLFMRVEIRLVVEHMQSRVAPVVMTADLLYHLINMICKTVC